MTTTRARPARGERSRMRILFLNPIGRIGGGERVLLDVLAELRAQRPDIERRLVLLEDGPLAAAARELGVAVSVLPASAGLASIGDSGLRSARGGAGGLGRVGSLAALAARGLLAAPALWRIVRQLRREIRAVAPDVVHSNGIKTHLLAALGTPRDVPLVWHVHDFVSSRPIVASWLRRLGARATPVAISRAVADDVANWLPGRRAAVVMNGVDLERFAPGPADGPALDRLSGLHAPARDVVRVGLVATYAHWKGQDVFLRAAAQLIRRQPEASPPARLYIIGGPIYSTGGSQFTRQQLVALADSLGIRGHVGFVDFQPDPAPVYRALDVVVHASTMPEPFGLTIAEAMACGRAVVVSAAGGAKELVTDGVDGLAVAPGDVDQLATAIQRLADDPALRRRLGGAARATAVAKFSRQRMTRELLALYGTLGR